MTISRSTAASPISSSISALQGAAWTWCNAGYHTPCSSTYREMGEALYRQDMSERIEALHRRSDEQNRVIDAALARAASSQSRIFSTAVR